MRRPAIWSAKTTRIRTLVGKKNISPSRPGFKRKLTSAILVATFVPSAKRVRTVSTIAMMEVLPPWPWPQTCANFSSATTTTGPTCQTGIEIWLRSCRVRLERWARWITRTERVQVWPKIPYRRRASVKAWTTLWLSISCTSNCARIWATAWMLYTRVSPSRLTLRRCYVSSLAYWSGNEGSPSKTFTICSLTRHSQRWSQCVTKLFQRWRQLSWFAWPTLNVYSHWMITRFWPVQASVVANFFTKGVAETTSMVYSSIKPTSCLRPAPTYLLSLRGMRKHDECPATICSGTNATTTNVRCWPSTKRRLNTSTFLMNLRMRTCKSGQVWRP